MHPALRGPAFPQSIHPIYKPGSGPGLSISSRDGAQTSVSLNKTSSSVSNAPKTQP